MIAFTLVRTVKLVAQKDPMFSMTTMAEKEEFDLWGLGFMFAIANVDPTIGTVKAYKVSYPADGQKKEEEVSLVDCRELLEGGSYAGQSNNAAFNANDIVKGRIDTEFLCPVDLDNVPLLGGYGSEEFEYFNVVVKGCSGQPGCESDENIMEGKAVNFVMLKT